MLRVQSIPLTEFKFTDMDSQPSSKQHGGSRSGAGRKRKANALTTIGVRVTPDISEKIKTAGGTNFLRPLIEQAVAHLAQNQQAGRMCPNGIPGYDALSSSSFTSLAYNRKLSIPMVEMDVPCGFPSPALDYSHEEVDLSELLIKNPLATYFVRATGDSMVDAGIFEGDILVIDRSVEARNGDIVLAYLNGEFTIKRLRIKEGVPTLNPENETADYKVIHPGPHDDFAVEGVVMWKLRKQR